MASNDTTESENMKPLYDDWFGQSTAPLLFRAINLESWELARTLLLERSQKEVSKELKFVDLYGYSAMHYSAWWSSTPPELFERILKLSPPDFPSMANRKGRSPLHLAAWRGRDEVVEHIARKYPEAASVTDRNEKSPLADACSRNRSKNVLQILIQADPCQINKRNLSTGISPVLIFFRIYHGFISAPHRTRFSQESEQQSFLDKASVILSAERGVVGNAKEWSNRNNAMQLLRASIESPSCPFSVVKLILDRFGSQISSFRDENGNTLLHFAVQAQPFFFDRFFKCDSCKTSVTVGQKIYFNRDPDKSHWGVRCCNARCSKPAFNRSFHYVQVPVAIKERAVVDYILTRHPELSSVKNASGKLALELALKSGRTWYTGIQELVRSNPSSISQACSLENLYPFQIAAMREPSQMETESDLQPSPAKKQKVSHEANDETANNGTKYELEKVGTIYHLLQQCPCLVKPFS